MPWTGPPRSGQLRSGAWGLLVAALLTAAWSLAVPIGYQRRPAAPAPERLPPTFVGSRHRA